MLDMRTMGGFAIATTVLLTVASAQSSTNSIPKCGDGQNCPSDTPCCSQYGQCGVGAYCLGGCDPRHSFDLLSCTAAPTCQSGNYALGLPDNESPNVQYLGDASQAYWVSSGTPANYGSDGTILLTMPPDSVGTLLSSTHYVWYGKITAQMTTSQGAGVVTAFIMMSDMKDEIDFEFVGVDLEHAQSNYYYQGITDYHNELNLTVSNTRENMHTYEIDWQPDSLTWSIDGNVMRTLNKNDTYNETDHQYHYPQTPSRVQLSLWPAGLASNGQGTIDWSGGLVDWNSQYMQNGYYYAQVKSVNVECYDPPAGFSQNYGSKAYYYTSTAGTQADVAMGNNNTILASFYATGDQPNVDPNASKTSSSNSASSSSANSNANLQTVPGVSAGGARTANGAPDLNAGSSSGSGSSGSSGGSSSGSNSGSSGVVGSTSFDQGTGTTGSSGAGKVAAGSGLALLGFFVAALML